jgi:hypothetical protein
MSEEEKCGCGCEGHHEVTTDEIARSNNLLLNALINALIGKKLVKEEEINKAAKELQKKMH